MPLSSPLWELVLLTPRHLPAAMETLCHLGGQAPTLRSE